VERVATSLKIIPHHPLPHQILSGYTPGAGVSRRAGVTIRYRRGWCFASTSPAQSLCWPPSSDRQLHLRTPRQAQSVASSARVSGKVSWRLDQLLEDRNQAPIGYVLGSTKALRVPERCPTLQFLAWQLNLGRTAMRHILKAGARIQRWLLMLIALPCLHQISPDEPAGLMLAATSPNGIPKIKHPMKLNSQIIGQLEDSLLSNQRPNDLIHLGRSIILFAEGPSIR
jgi:hypothetical protein